MSGERSKKAPDDSVARMRPPATWPRRDPAERLTAWLFTGPLGHLYSVVADLTVYFVRSMLKRAKRRLGRS